MAMSLTVKHTGSKLRLWEVTAVGDVVVCTVCNSQYSVAHLYELMEKRAAAMVSTPWDVYCCALPPSSIHGAKHVGALLRHYGILSVVPLAQPASTSAAPPVHIYKLEHRGKTFRMHSVTSRVANSALSCCICKKEFPLETVIAMLDIYADSRCRDITCCQRVTGAPGGVGDLAVFSDHRSPTASLTLAQPAEPKAVCRWCKGTGRVTLLTTSVSCDCVKQENVGGYWKNKVRRA